MSTNNKCPDPVYLTRAFSEGPNEALCEHLENCEHCQNEWRKISHLVEAGRKLPIGYPNEKRLDDVRIEIFAGALAPKPSMSRAKVGAFAVFVIAFIALAFAGTRYIPSIFDNERNRASGEIYRAKIIPQGFATYSVESSQPNEVVRLKTGTIRVMVDPLMPDERFRVIIGSAEVIVRGTVFDVMAENDKLIDVQVQSGKVEVRPHVLKPIALGPGQSLNEKQLVDKQADEKILVAQNVPPKQEFTKSSKASDANNSLMISKKKSITKKELNQNASKTMAKTKVEKIQPAPSKEESQNAVSIHAKSLSQIAFENGWAALREGNHSKAAQSFAQAIEQAGDSPLVEDATFWHAVALARSGKTTQAKNALNLFISIYPRSPRKGEASVMLGWILVRAGDFDNAKLHFNSAIGDRVSHVRESAAKGLAEIDKRKGAIAPGSE